jgi:hypothetical protein
MSLPSDLLKFCGRRKFLLQRAASFDNKIGIAGSIEVAVIAHRLSPR